MLVEKYWDGLVKNGCCHSVHKTLELAVSQKGINVVN